MELAMLKIVKANDAAMEDGLHRMDYSAVRHTLV
jgi:hypothetical protein